MRGRGLLGGQHRCQKWFGGTRPATSVISSAVAEGESGGVPACPLWRGCLLLE